VCLIELKFDLQGTNGHGIGVFVLNIWRQRDRYPPPIRRDPHRVIEHLLEFGPKPTFIEAVLRILIDRYGNRRRGHGGLPLLLMLGIMF
jgi:hypothetical protein